MSIWKTLFIVAFGGVCLALGLATIVVPLTIDEYRWLWLTGLLFATVCLGTLFALFLKKLDSTFE
jgi:hypothetical protein